MRYSGHLGVAEQQEVRPGIWEETITEHEVLGTVKQKTEVLDIGDSILPRHRMTTSISVFSRVIGQEDTSPLRYVTYAGKRWTVETDVTKFPRLIMYIREEYHGPKPDGAA